MDGSHSFVATVAELSRERQETGDWGWAPGMNKSGEDSIGEEDHGEEENDMTAFSGMTRVTTAARAQAITDFNTNDSVWSRTTPFLTPPSPN